MKKWNNLMEVRTCIRKYKKYGHSDLSKASQFPFDYINKIMKDVYIEHEIMAAKQTPIKSELNDICHLSDVINNIIWEYIGNLVIAVISIIKIHYYLLHVQKRDCY